MVLTDWELTPDLSTTASSRVKQVRTVEVHMATGLPVLYVEKQACNFNGLQLYRYRYSTSSTHTTVLDRTGNLHID